MKYVMNDFWLYTEAKFIPPYPKPPWTMTESYFHTNSTYHGTTITRGKQLVKTQKPSLEFFGLGADINFTKKKYGRGLGGLLMAGRPPGFYGKGFYVTSNKSGAGTYAQLKSKGMVLRCIIEPGSIVDSAAVSDDALIAYYMEWLPKIRAAKGLPVMEPERLQGYASMLRRNSESFYQEQWIETMNNYAVENGKKGVNYLRGSEIVIFDVSAVECIVDVEKTYEELKVQTR